jgi:UDP-N-acetylmuramoyl-tripeptide--D-alanyl-D-alanine ligase
MLKSHKDLIVIGITGSYGKTSTKFILETILSQEFTTLVTPNSYNTTLGVVITIRNKLNRSHEVFVAEMGAKQKGDIKEICDLVEPDYGIITAVGPQHLETFGNLNNIIQTKFELAQAAKLKAIVNGDSNNVKKGKILFADPTYISYGTDDNNEVRIDEVKQTIHGSTFTLSSQYGKQIYQTRLLGMHNILNIAAAISMALELGMTYEKIARGVKEIKAIEHRLELKKQNDYYILDDAFNSNPSGAKFALDVLAQFESGKKIIMTPGMIELGDMDEEVHIEFGKQIANVCDIVILIGENKTRHIVKGLKQSGYDMDKVQIKRTVYDGFAYIRSVISKGDVVLIENDLPDNFNE